MNEEPLSLHDLLRRARHVAETRERNRQRAMYLGLALFDNVEPIHALAMYPDWMLNEAGVSRT